MKAITLTPPWGTLIALGAKKIETRSWSTSYRGPLAIHQGSNLKPVGGREGYLEQCRAQPFFTELIRHKPNRAGMFYDDDYFMSLPMGKIVAVCHLVAIEEMLPGDDDTEGFWKIIGGKRMHWPLTDQERAFGDYSPGRYAWLLADIRALPEPIPMRGQLGLWDVDDAFLSK